MITPQPPASTTGSTTGSTTRSFRLGIAGSTLEGAGAALTWAGLPLYVATLTGDPRQLAWLFTAQALAGIVMSFVAGNLTDRFSPRVLMVGPALAIAGFQTAAFLLLGPSQLWPFYVLGVLNAVAAAMASNALRVWLGAAAPPEALARSLGRRGVWVAGSKLAGTSAGPLLFHAIGPAGLLVSAALLVGGALLYVGAVRGTSAAGDPKGGERPTKRFLAGWESLLGDRVLTRLLGVHVVVALLGVPMTALLLELLHGLRETSPAYFAAFWTIGFVGSIAANGLMATGVFDRWSPRRTLACCFAGSFLALAAIVVTGNALLFLALVGTLVVCRTILGVTVFTVLYPQMKPSQRGRVLSVNDFFADGLGFAALMALSLLPVDWLSSAAVLYLALLAPVALVNTWRLPSPVAVPSSTSGANSA